MTIDEVLSRRLAQLQYLALNIESDWRELKRLGFNSDTLRRARLDSWIEEAAVAALSDNIPGEDREDVGGRDRKLVELRRELDEQRHVDNRRIDALHDLSVKLGLKTIEVENLKQAIREYGKVCEGHYTYADSGKALCTLLALVKENDDEDVGDQG